MRKERSERAELERKNRELKDKNKQLEAELKKKDEKYDNSLTEIRDLKNDVLTERNEREVLRVLT